jgi:hypothetical protein
MPETLTMIRGGGAPRIVVADDSVAMRNARGGQDVAASRRVLGNAFVQ